MKPIFRIATLNLIILFAHSSFAQADYYWVGGSGSWSDFSSHWATSSGGSEFHTAIPSDIDNVYFDENSFIESDQIVEIDTTATCHHLTFEEVLFHPTIRYEGDNEEVDFENTGSVVLGDANFELGWWYYIPVGDQTFDPNGAGLPGCDFTFGLKDGGVSLLDSLYAADIAFSNVFNDFHSNGHSMHATEYFGFRLSLFAKLDFTGSDIYTKRFDAKSFRAPDGDVITNGASMTILYPEGYTQIDKTRYPNPLFENFTLKADHSFQNDSPVLDNLIIEPGVTMYVHHYMGDLEVNQLIARGAPNQRVTIRTLVDGNTASIVQTSGTVDVYMTDIVDVNASGGAVFDAHASTGEINFEGWNFVKADQSIEMELGQKDFDDINQAFEIAPGASSGLMLDLVSSNEDVAIISGPNEYTIIGMGTAQITANQPGDDLFNPAQQLIRVLEVTKAPQQISFEEISDTSFDADFYNLEAISSSGLDISYQVVGPATLSNNTLVFTAPGTVQVTATQPGNENYLEADAVHRVFEILKIEQTIDMVNTPLQTDVLDESVFLSAISSSGLEVSFNVVGPAVLDGSQVVFNGAGMVEIIATQSGDETYAPAPAITQVIEVSKADQIISFDPIETEYSALDGPLALNATSASDLPVSFSVTGPASLDENILIFNGTGTVEVTAVQPGNDMYLSADPVVQTFEIVKAQQTIGFNPIEDVSIDLESIELDAVASSELAIEYSIVGPATLVGNRLFLDAEGIVEITASQSGNDLYLAADDVVITFEILPGEAPLSISNEAVEISVYPNPVINYLNFSKSVTNVLVMNQKGQKMSEIGLNAQNQLDVSTLSRGIYIVSFEYMGEPMKSRIIKN